MKLPRFRRFGPRLLLLIAGLVTVSQVTTYLLVSRANRQNALVAIDEALQRGALQFQAIADRREADLLLAARMMAGDYALRQLFLVPRFSASTARSALLSYRKRIDAPVVVMLDPDGAPIAAIGSAEGEADLASFIALRDIADASESFEAAGWAFIGDTLHQIVVVPMLAPPPEVVAWIGLGFPVDRGLAEDLKTTSGLEVTFLRDNPEPAVIASTMPPAKAEQLARATRPGHLDAPIRLTLLDEDYVTAYRGLPGADGRTVWVALQRSLETELAASRDLEKTLAVITLASLVGAVVAALGLARSIARPVHQLAKHTQRISYGDYDTRIELERVDELGELAEAFNHMSDGLAERDRVRDLLDKNVSPEVAASMLRDGLALGGEEREVTILFCDMRDFTTLAEQLSPRELVTLLNRFLDRMSAAIEAEGGVIDKYIGDEIMALFGAPVAATDSADRAARAALGMRAALARLNEELAAEGRPPLAFGIGINTARVIAGNIGSHRRLNYSVVGDGVNLAARVQPLTRKPEFATDIIITGSVGDSLRGGYRLRLLGKITVKGKSVAATIYALDSAA